MERKPLKIAALILAAGSASRMGAAGHKLLARFEGLPLVRRSALAALESQAESVTVVTGFRGDDVAAALEGLALRRVQNPDHAAGMGGSLAAGARAALAEAPEAEGLLIALADMPTVSSAHMNALIAAFRRAEGRAILRATAEGKPGHPVIFPKALFPALLRLTGDEGARWIVAASGAQVLGVEVGAAALLDVDRPAEVIAAGGCLEKPSD